MTSAPFRVDGFRSWIKAPTRRNGDQRAVPQRPLSHPQPRRLLATPAPCRPRLLGRPERARHRDRRAGPSAGAAHEHLTRRSARPAGDLPHPGHRDADRLRRDDGRRGASSSSRLGGHPPHDRPSARGTRHGDRRPPSSRADPPSDLAHIALSSTHAASALGVVWRDRPRPSAATRAVLAALRTHLDVATEET